jgi:hypothetical protein
LSNAGIDSSYTKAELLLTLPSIIALCFCNRLFLDLPPESYKTDYARGDKENGGGFGLMVFWALPT